MKDFKARAWDKDRNEYIDFSSLCCPSWSLGEILANYELELYTGLKDKNGREIYEWDVVIDMYGNVGKVYWEGTGFVILNTSGAVESGERWEIIGNIRENKELLSNG